MSDEALEAVDRKVKAFTNKLARHQHRVDVFMQAGETLAGAGAAGFLIGRGSRLTALGMGIALEAAAFFEIGPHEMLGRMGAGAISANAAIAAYEVGKASKST